MQACAGIRRPNDAYGTSFDNMGNSPSIPMTANLFPARALSSRTRQPWSNWTPADGGIIIMRYLVIRTYGPFGSLLLVEHPIHHRS